MSQMLAVGDERYRMLGRGDLERGRVIAAVVDWLEIRHRELSADPRGLAPKTIESLLTGIEADIAHSSLLFRLLEGKRPLPKPPPRMFSYPAYELMEGPGPFRLIDVHFEPEPSKRVLIEQAWWTVAGRPPKREGNENQEWWVEWPGNSYDIFRLWQEAATGKWWMAQAGSDGDA